MPTTLSSKASQDFVPIKEVHDGVVVLKDGSLRGIIMTSSINFALKSEENQQALIFQFQTYLNSLDFSSQIYIQSRKLDIRPYLALLEEQQKEQQNELFKIQTREYIEFVRSFTENSNIMTKSFFVVVPYARPIIKGKRFGFGSNKNSDKKNAADAFEEGKTQLLQRMSVVEQGLTRSGIRIVRLGTEEIIELFYKIFNPGDSEKPLQVP